MRAKLVVSNVVSNGESDRVSFRAVCKSDGYGADGLDENNTFSKFSPSADLHMSICNPELVGKYKVGDTFYVDFTPVLVVQRNPQ
jgi:hypothetical protein